MLPNIENRNWNEIFKGGQNELCLRTLSDACFADIATGGDDYHQAFGVPREKMW